MLSLYNQIGILDFIILAIFIIGAFLGVKSGIIVELSSIVAIGFSIFFYSKLFSIISKFIEPWVDNKSVLPYLSAAAFFILTSVSSMIVSRLLRFFIRMTPMGILDKSLGAFIGAIKWTFYASILIWMLSTANNQLREKFFKRSVSYSILYALMPSIYEKIIQMPRKGKSYLRKKAANTIKKQRKVNPHLDI